jgi:MOSC domain-containing protein YiiM
MQPTLRPGFSGTLLTIQTGQVRPLMVGGRKLVSAIGKTTVSGPIAVGVLGLAGDEQADLSVHGGLSKAVYALPSEHLPWWQAQRQTHGATMFEEPLAPGYLGENLSLQGLLEHELFMGDRLDFGDVVLRVTQPREPCGKLNAVMG